MDMGKDQAQAADMNQRLAETLEGILKNQATLTQTLTQLIEGQQKTMTQLIEGQQKMSVKVERPPKREEETPEYQTAVTKQTAIKSAVRSDGKYDWMAEKFRPKPAS